MENIERLREALGQALKPMEVLFGFKPNYTPQSLRKMEEAINQMYPFGQREYLFALSLSLGFYLAEVIVKHTQGAKYIDFTDHPIDLEIEIPIGEGEMRIKPILRMHKFLNVDREDTIFGLFNMIQDLQTGRLQLNSEGEWIHTSRNYKYRSVSVPTEEAEKQGFNVDDLFKGKE